MIDFDAPDFWVKLFSVVADATLATLYMISVSMALTVIIGFPLAVVLVGTERGGILEKPFGSRALGAVINRTLEFVVNFGRSVPFIVLMVALIPLTRLIVGKFIGSTAAIVPLTIVAIPFFIRIVEIALKELDPGLQEAAHSLGASRWHIVTKFMLPEALPAIVLGGSTTVTSIINFSAMVGVVGGGGLGDVAMRYGYQRYSTIHMIVVIIVLFVIVQIFQGFANWWARHRGRVQQSKRVKKTIEEV